MTGKVFKNVGFQDNFIKHLDKQVRIVLENCAENRGSVNWPQNLVSKMTVNVGHVNLLTNKLR